ncbi:MAG: PQQ-dependent sugar dehydrogenase [Candidatus Dadabacteria bacterium]|nr:PQQ-dependent sugar dehydrogenase [Candidatus Dadabacteria bacterium]
MRGKFFMGISSVGIILIVLALFLDITTGKSSRNDDINRKNAVTVQPWARLELKPVASGFSEPTYLTNAKDDSGRIFVVEKEGRIKIIKEGKVLSKPFLDIVSRVRSKGSEQGLFSVAFHPKYKQNGRFLVNYTDLNGDTVISEYKVSDNLDKALLDSERIILKIDQPASNHNGGQLQFGPDGYLYIGMGDGGRAGDPWGNAQNKNVLLGKMLRIDVDSGEPYGIPKNNPFALKKNIREEIWAYGVRNPWRFSFDPVTGDMYIADVGQDDWEEIHFQLGDSKGGENYGWDLMEGFHDFELPKGYDKKTLAMPILEYNHELGCSITGGYVYRGKRYQSISGTYLFGDFCSGKIWGLKRNQKQDWEWAEFLDTPLLVSSFGEDENGEIYVLDFKKGGIYHLSAIVK